MRLTWRRRDFSIERHRSLQRDQRNTMTNVSCESLVQRFCFFFKYAARNVDTGSAKLGKPLTADQRIRVLHGSDHAGDSGGNDGIGARWGASLMRTRLQVDIESRATRSFASLLDGKDLGMFHAIVGVATASDNGAVSVHDDSANIWIG